RNACAAAAGAPWRNTTCTTPAASRRSTRITPPWPRRRATQPARVTWYRRRRRAGHRPHACGSRRAAPSRLGPACILAGDRSLSDMSGKTAAAKLGIRPDATVYPINPPGDYAALVGGLPDGAQLTKQRPADVVHAFA